MVGGHFSFYIRSYGNDTALVVIDDNQGGMSVTNDMENVLRYIAIKLSGNSNFPHTAVCADNYSMPIIYKDSNGVYDGVRMVDEKAEFILLQERDEDIAIQKMVERMKKI